MTFTSTLTSKNQTTIPKAVVEALAAKPSAKLCFEIEPDGKITITAKTRTFAELAGTFPKTKLRRPVTIEEMNAAVRRGRFQAISPLGAMIGLDTNILIRYLTHDDELQLVAVLRLLNRKGAVFYVSELVMVEIDWVLEDSYHWNRIEIVEALARLLTIHNLIFENEEDVKHALWAMRKGADLADALIAARCREHGCQELATFDAGFAKLYPRFAFVPK